MEIDLPEDLQKPSEERDQFVMDMIPYVKYLAHRIAINLPPSVDINDLVNFGVIGLLDACKKFDHAEGVKFKTYAEMRIRGAILDGIRAADWVPRSVRKKRRQLEASYHRVQQELGRRATDEEIAADLGIQISELQVLQCDTGLSLGSVEEFPTVEDLELRLCAGFVNDPQNDDQHAIAEREEMRRVVAGVIGELPERQRMICSLYYYDELTMKEIGEVLSIGESRVSQLHSKAMNAIRERLISFMAGRSPRPVAPSNHNLGNAVPVIHEEPMEEAEMPEPVANLELLGLSEGTADVLARNRIRTTDDLTSTSIDTFLRIRELHARAKKKTVESMVEKKIWFKDGEQATVQLLEPGGCAHPGDKKPPASDKPKSVRKKDGETAPTQVMKPVTAVVPTANGHNALAQLVGGITRSFSDQISGEGVDVSEVSVRFTITVGGKSFHSTTIIEPVKQQQ